MRRQRILVSGMGIAGPTLAYWLLRYGFEVTLVEHAEAPRRGGSMIDFWGAGYDVAERMQLLPELQRRGYRIEQVQLVSRHGARVAGFDAGVLRAATHDRFLSLPRGDLAACILETLNGDAGVLFGDSVRNLTQHQDGVDASFERSAPNRFDLVIGADGLHSATRRLAFRAEESSERFLGYCVATFSAAAYEPRSEGVYVAYNTPGRQAARFALRDGRTGFFLVFATPDRPAVRPHDRAAQHALLRRMYEGTGWECDAIVDAMGRADDLYFDAVSQIMMPRWWEGRIALVGDAASCPSLLAGEGASMAMGAAYVLAKELADADGDARRAFPRYEGLLRPYIERKQHAARRNGSWFAPRSRAAISVRNALTRLMNTPFLGSWLARRFVLDKMPLA